MKTKYLIVLLAGTASAVAGINCAPVDPPASTEPRSNEPRPPMPPGPPPGSAAVPRFEPIPSPAPPAPAPSDAIKQRIDLAIDHVRARQLRTDNGFWTVFHGILGLGPSVTLEDPLTGRKVNALDYICAGGRIPGLHFIPTSDGLDVETGPGTFEKQGHQDQFVAEMVEWNVAPERKFKVDGQDHTFADFLRCSKARASANPKRNQELEWALVIIGTHYGTDAEWTNAFGEKVRFEDLVRAELNKDVDKAVCGGTHLLFGLTWVYHLHMKNGGEPTGVWKEVADRIAAYKTKARATQNADGTFSTDFFPNRAEAPDANRRINTTGHILEWLSLAMTDEELRQPWVQDAANALAMLYLSNEQMQLEGGGMYHGVHGLLIYRSRVYGSDKLGDLKPHVPPPPPPPPKKG